MMYKGSNGCWFNLSRYRNFYIEKNNSKKFCIYGTFGNLCEENDFIEGWFDCEVRAQLFLDLMIDGFEHQVLSNTYEEIEKIIFDKKL